MKPALIALVAAACLMSLGTVHAAENKPQKPAAAQKAAKKPAKRAAKKPAKSKAAAPKPVPAAAVDQPLTEAEKNIAKLVHTGTISCDLNTKVSLEPDADNPGHFFLHMGKLRYHMRPMESRTGAVRLEDTRARALWLQLGNKSMLMDQKQGKRIADGCMSPEQSEFSAQMDKMPRQSLFDQKP